MLTVMHVHDNSLVLCGGAHSATELCFSALQGEPRACDITHDKACGVIGCFTTGCFTWPCRPVRPPSAVIQGTRRVVLRAAGQAMQSSVPRACMHVLQRRLACSGTVSLGGHPPTSRMTQAGL